MCIVPATALDISRIFAKLGIGGVGPDNPLSEETLLGELKAYHPVLASLAWDGGGGHVIIVRGYEKRYNLFSITDPFFGDYSLFYPDLCRFRMGRVSGVWALAYGRFFKVVKS